MTEVSLKISLNDFDRACLRQCLVQAGGYAGPALRELTGKDNTFWDSIIHTIKNNESLVLSKDEWKSIYEGINVVIYELGPEDLHTLTGYDLDDVASMNLAIYRQLQGRNIYCLWRDAD